MITPQELEALLKVMNAHGCVELQHGDLTVRTTAGGSVVAQQPALPQVIQSFDAVHSLADLDSVYGIPSITKEGE
jgi:hypothetical protein